MLIGSGINAQQKFCKDCLQIKKMHASKNSGKKNKKVVSLKGYHYVYAKTRVRILKITAGNNRPDKAKYNCYVWK